jgi:hypothetical protein
MNQQIIMIKVNNTTLNNLSLHYEQFILTLRPIVRIFNLSSKIYANRRWIKSAVITSDDPSANCNNDNIWVCSSADTSCIRTTKYSFSMYCTLCQIFLISFVRHVYLFVYNMLTLNDYRGAHPVYGPNQLTCE